MELTTVLVTHLHPFSNNISLGSNELDDALDASLIAFTVDTEAAVPSYLGLPLTIRQNGHPVTLTRLAPIGRQRPHCGYRARSSGPDSTRQPGQSLLVWCRDCPPPRSDLTLNAGAWGCEVTSPWSASRSERREYGRHCVRSRTTRWNVQSTPKSKPKFTKAY